ncbi:MAG: aminoacyl-tRNA hydrolase [Candidatus Poseidonia sp.]|nr:aminoacyl-tRNA hydrolase [Poseidonia sp.]
MSPKDELPSMALIVRQDLGLSTGKTAVQCAHAAVQCTLVARKSASRLFERWRAGGARKISLTTKDVESLHRLASAAQQANLIFHLVVDAGHTEVAPGTVTVLGIGPAPRRALDAIVGELSTL